MNENDRILIIDLIDGRLSPTQEKGVLALVAADPQLRAEYETQRAIAARLATETSPLLTPLESARLRSELKTLLHLDDPVPVAAASSSRRSRWLAPLGGFAVAAAVIVGAFVVLPGTLSGDDSTDSFEVAIAETATTAAAGMESREAPPSDVDAAKGSPQGDVSINESESLSEVDDAAGAAVGGQAFDEAAPTAIVVIPSVDDVDLKELAKAYALDPGDLGESLATRSVGASPEATEQAYTCAAVASKDAGTADVLPVAITTHDGLDAVIVAIVPSSGDPYLAAYDLDSCTEFATTLR
jgi:anti-sigma factor RsiW